MLVQLWRFVAGATWVVLLIVGLAIGAAVGGVIGLAIGATTFELGSGESIRICRNAAVSGGIAGGVLGILYATRVWLKTLTPDLAAR